MIVVFFTLFVVVIVTAVIAGLVSGTQKAKPRNNRQEKSSTPHFQSKTGIDSLNLPPSLSSDEKELILKIANRYGIRYVTQADLKRHAIQEIGSDFAAMSGWDIWDISIHEAPGQYERLGRALSKKISILCYDPEYRLAKVQGVSSVYLTSCKRCSCPDYRERRLPCKHMYALALSLEGDVSKRILDTCHAPLYGLTLALAGHLPRQSKGVGGIRNQITDLGGMWSDDINPDSSALVLGLSPSAARVNRAVSFDMEVLSPETISDLFTLKQREMDANIQNT